MTIPTTTEPTCPKCGHELLFSDEATVPCKKPVRTAEAKDKSTAETHADDFEACGCYCAAPATEPSVEMLKQIAEDLMAPAIGKVAPMVWREMVADIEAALKERMEKDAEIAEKCHEQPCICQTCLIHAEAAAAIRRAIRNE